MNRRIALAAIAGCLLLAGAPGASAAPDIQVAVQRRGDLLVVDAAFVAPFSQREAWEVLTDFDTMSRFVPNLEASRITQREGDRLRVEQRGVARWGPLTHPFTMVRTIELQPMSQVRSESIDGSLRQVKSLTRFAAVAGGTEIRHHIEFGIDTWMPDLLVEPFLRHEVREQFEAVVEEMLRRRAAAGR
jgi:ribosome-associated toxin RatA of RatAB toxin-antitoxin module